MLKQPPLHPVLVEEQIVAIWAVTNGYLDEIAVDKIREFEQEFISNLKLREKKLLQEIADKKELSEDVVKKLDSLTKDLVKTFLVRSNRSRPTQEAKESQKTDNKKGRK